MAEDGTGVDPAVIEAVREAAEAMGAAASRLEGSTEGTAPGATASREARLAREKTILGQIAGIYQQIETSIKNSFDAGAKLGDSLADMALNADKVDLSLKNVVGSTKSLGSSFMNVGKQLAQMPLVAGEIVKKFAGIATRFGEITAGYHRYEQVGCGFKRTTRLSYRCWWCGWCGSGRTRSRVGGCGRLGTCNRWACSHNN